MTPAQKYRIAIKQIKSTSIGEIKVEMTPDLAEVCGIHAGDGYLGFRNNKIYQLSVSGSFEEEKYYVDHVVPLFERTFDIKIKHKFYPKSYTYGFHIWKKNVCVFMHSLGFPFGKKTYAVKVPSSILESADKKIIYRFLRGLFDTDGSLSFRRRKRLRGITEHSKRHTYPRILLDVCSKDLHIGVSELLTKTGFKFSISSQKAKGNHSKKYKICLAGDKNLLLWMRKVGFKNSVKRNRFLIWDRFGFVPPKLKLLDQRRVLSGKVNPNKFYTDGNSYYPKAESILEKNKQQIIENMDS